MNKFKKTAIAVTSAVMAGTMVFGLVGCGGGDDDDSVNVANASEFVELLNTSYGLSTRTTANASGWSTAKSYWTYLSSHLDTNTSSTGYSNTYDNGTKINIAIGYNSATTGAFYASSGTSGVIGNPITLPGNYTATAGGIKPAFSAIQDALNIEFVNKYTNLGTSANLDGSNSDSLVSKGTWGTSVDIATTDLSVAVTQANNNQNILNLADYLDQMPNFKAFLEENPVVYLSLLQSGMSTSDGTGMEIYVAPYFDGNDDIERYCLIRQDWVEELLDDDLAYDGDTYATACASTTSVSGGWMGTTGSYTIVTSTEADKGETTFTLTKDYSAALTAAANTSTPLGGAYSAIAGSAYAGTSGNIVDIMNAAIAANSGATGKQLATLYRAYIDVAYKNGSDAAYTKRSDLFNGYSAAWDVDDLVAMLRIVKTNSANVGLASCTTEGIFPRDGTNDRTPDIVRLAAQLYGERGADSRYEYTYIDKDGNLQDARANASFWECLESFGELASEGLVYNYYSTDGVVEINGTTLKGNTSNAGTGFMMYDYSQTQTTQMYDSMLDTNYMFGAINTPVSKWDVDGDGNHTDIMRFTESWRSTKTSGLAVAADVAKDTNKLNAVLAFIDYLYSNDGQITSTYGIQSTNGNTNPNGTWYGTEVSTTETSEGLALSDGTVVATKVGGQYVVKEDYEGTYFCFNDTLYTGTNYKGKATPTITTELYNSFLDDSGDVYTTFKQRGSFTGYARAVLGATLPMGVKDQSFENQLTAPAAAEAATKVGVSISNETIKHVTLEVNSSNYWYTTVPTGLPLSGTQQSVIDDSSQTNLKGMTGTNIASSKNFAAIFHHIIWYGYSGTYSYQGVVVNFG